MPDKRKRPYSISRFFFKLLTVIPETFSAVRHITSLIEYEACKAAQKIFMLCVLLLCALTLLLSTWFSLLIMFYLLLTTTLKFTPQLALFVILFGNIFLLIILLLIIKNLKRGILFPETRELIKTYRNR